MDANTLQWIGCALGVAGSGLLAIKTRFAGWGFAAFLASNAAWFAYGIITSAPGLIVQQVFFTATSLLGIWNWLVKPAFLKPQQA